MIRLVVVGRVKGVLGPAVAEYEGRIPHYFRFEVVEVETGGGRGKGSDPARVMEEEGKRILARVPDDADLWVLTREGRGLDSAGLARRLAERQLHAAPLLVLAIGGAFGFAPDVTARASFHMSLSPMTFPHEVARLLVAEQLYRAGTILRGEPYHKGAT